MSANLNCPGFRTQYTNVYAHVYAHVHLVVERQSVRKLELTYTVQTCPWRIPPLPSFRRRRLHHARTHARTRTSTYRHTHKHTHTGTPHAHQARTRTYARDTNRARAHTQKHTNKHSTTQRKPQHNKHTTKRYLHATYPHPLNPSSLPLPFLAGGGKESPQSVRHARAHTHATLTAGATVCTNCRAGSFSNSTGAWRRERADAAAAAASWRRSSAAHGRAVGGGGSCSSPERASADHVCVCVCVCVCV